MLLERTPTYHHLVVLGGGGTSTRDVVDMLNDLSAVPNSHKLVVSSNPEILNGSEDGAIADHALAIVSASAETRTDEQVIHWVQWCLDHYVPVYFVCDVTNLPFEGQAPEILSKINGMPYQNAADLREICTRLVQLVGYDEREQSVFISYRRIDGHYLATDLRYALLDRGWDVFLDRFNIAPGAEFQLELTRDLDGRSLVLLVESPSIRSSQWVEHEVAFAKSHGIGLHAVKPPTTTEEQCFPGIDEDRRSRLKQERFEPGDGSDPPGLAELVSTLQHAHTAALRARRDSTVATAQQTLESLGYKVEQLEEWAIRGSKPGRRSAVVLVTPRSPRPADLRRVHRLRGGQPERRGSDGWVLHPLETANPDVEQLLRWLTKGRRLHTCALMNFRERLTR